MKPEEYEAFIKLAETFKQLVDDRIEHLQITEDIEGLEKLVSAVKNVTLADKKTGEEKP